MRSGLDDGVCGEIHNAVSKRRWAAVYFECFAVIMSMLNTTDMTSALSAIRSDLGFSERSLIWTVNGYMIPYGGFMFLLGKIGDCYGHRRLFMSGVGIVICASASCALSASQAALIWARAFQGLGAAAVLTGALALILRDFERMPDRAKALGIFGIACTCGGNAGPLIGGVVASALGWRWIFFLNVLTGILPFALGWSLIDRDKPNAVNYPFDLGGAAAVTGSLSLATWAAQISQTETLQATAAALGALALFLLFLVIEIRVPNPLISLRLFQRQNFSATLVAGALWAAAQSAWFYFCALYLQLVLKYDTLHVALAFLPVNLTTAIIACGFSATMVTSFGVKVPFTLGVLIIGVGFFLFATIPAGSAFAEHVLPAMLLIGAGAGGAYAPLIASAVGNVAPEEAGAVSGVVNAVLVMAGALGVAFLGDIASARTSHLAASSSIPSTALLLSGYRLVFGIGAGMAVIASIIGVLYVDSGDVKVTQHYH